MMIPHPRIIFFCLLLLIVDVRAKCLNPSVRREWRKLPTDQRAEWIAAVRCLNKLPHDPALKPSFDRAMTLIPPVNVNSSFWDDISYMHMDLNPLIHLTSIFLVWHRAYVWGVENAMKTKCNYTGAQPYWDWTQDAHDFYHATILDDDPKSGFGGWGDPANDYQITTGGFAKDFMLAYPILHGVRRNFTVQPFLGGTTLGPIPVDPNLYINTTFTKSNTDLVVDSFIGDFEGFQTYFGGIQGPHPGPHIILGGEMIGSCPSGITFPDCIPGNKWSTNDPLFFVHHAMVDKLWYDWQKKHPSNRYAFQGSPVSEFAGAFPDGAPINLNFSTKIPNDGLLWKDLTIWDVMDTMGEHLCYVYE